MRQITKLVLEKGEVAALVKGKVLTLRLPSGETVQFEGERTSVDSVDGHVNIRGEMTKKILSFVRAGKTYSAMDLKTGIGAEGWEALSRALTNLAKQGLLKKTKTGGVTNVGHPKYLYSKGGNRNG